MQIVILAGGKGARLYPLTETIPKSLIQINKKPFLTYQIELLKKNKIKQIILCVGKFHQKIIDYYGNGEKFGVSINYFVEDEDNLLGTGGALKNAYSLLRDIFFVMYGDSYLPINFQEVLDSFKKSGKSGLMSVYKNDNKYDKSNVAIHNNIVTIYDKSGKEKGLSYIDYGLLVLKKEVISLIPENKFVNLDFLINKLIEKKELECYEIRDRFYEIGSLDGIRDFEDYVKSKI